MTESLTTKEKEGINSNSKPILSICIPTYNRAEVLKNSLNSLVTQEDFSKIEVIIADNCSTDNTEEVAKQFQKNYPNVVYVRNEENIRDRNFPTVMMNAHGIYRKLFNDTILYQEGFLSYLINKINANISEKPCIFFLNGSRDTDSSDIMCNSFDELVYAISFYSTWIGGFGLWEEDCSNLESDFDMCATNLWQTYKLFSIFSKRKKCLVLNEKMISIQELKKKDVSYGLFRVFHNTYLDLLSPYIKSDLLTMDCFEWQKKDLLYSFFKTHILNFELQKRKFILNKSENLKKLVFNEYKKQPYFKDFKRAYNTLKKQELHKKHIMTLKNMVSCSIIGKLLLSIKRKLNLKLY